ncbi:hypothetical protein D7294_03680 [Streptomyces hoynatensis]|uniref:IPT/TIG domain-containing protein n=2 Tax=Streptomyces hoynatensis TaxID=1141874 RepID=A0A3A9ZB99_9ACTN|nr:hypothetical protein D7294_03680 [Streptomyces hoynatensis]
MAWLTGLVVSAVITTAVGVWVTNAIQQESGEQKNSADAPEISVDPGAGEAGQPFEVTGSAFAPGEKVELYWPGGAAEDIILGTDTADAEGNVSFSPTVPDSAEVRAEPYMLFAQYNDGANRAQRAFMVGEWDSQEDEGESAPALSLAPGNGSPGSLTTLTATGFTPGELIDVYWYSNRYDEAGGGWYGEWLQMNTETVLVDETGGFSLTLQVPAESDPGYPYAESIVAAGSDGQDYAETSYSVYGE